ncbi:MAG: Gfo/Idh/MocA family oxidoreductase [Candidatus Sumerlaeia bacterium]|nr:Gfo/Idh/MocA family oxidoreductase [Candidatus Sumerlaeia bacterium]
MKPFNRRKFIATTAKGMAQTSTGVTLLAGAQRVSAAPPQNRSIRLALIGCGGRGSSVIRRFARRPGVEIVCLCDLDKREGHELLKQIEKEQGTAPKRVYRYQDVLEDPAVDAVVIATPDHWHGPLTIYACQAGKDVYVEKPPSHNIWEGRKMVEAARKYQRVVQVGTQTRSAAYVQKALDYIRSGKLGDIRLCKVFNMLSTGPYKESPNSEPPPEVDWNTWLGPAPLRPYNEDILHGRWHQYWAYSGGLMADDGIHQLDCARLLLGKDYPNAVYCRGGNLAYKDEREVPDTQIVTYDFGDVVMTFEQTWWTPYMKKIPDEVRNGDLFPYWPGTATRVELYGTKGVMFFGRHGGGWQVFTADGKIVAQEFGRQGDDPHQENFLQCIRDRSRPTADIEEGHRSAVMVHLANISYRVGCREVKFDPKTETIVGDAEANKLLKRDYRPPFVIPENV